MPAAVRQLSQGLAYEQLWSCNRLNCSFYRGGPFAWGMHYHAGRPCCRCLGSSKHCFVLWFALSDLFFLTGLGGGTTLCRRPLLLYALPYAGQPRRLLLLLSLVLLSPL